MNRCRFITSLMVLLQLVIYTSCCSDGDKPIFKTDAFVWYPNRIEQGNNYKGTALSDTMIVSTLIESNDTINRQWTLTNDISSYPQYTAPTILEEAIYNMALDEMVNAVEADNTLRTGQEWAGVWTRDVSYSIILSMAYMQPEAAMQSLLHKVNSRMRIIQDTGTGGAWPCSTDRMIWSVAAWELYLVTGDIDWLQFIYPIICNSIEDDRLVAYNEEYGLMMGESSFIDWREQSYPVWMEPADIYKSICLGTNAVHCQSLRVASKMAHILGDTQNEVQYKEWSDSICVNINRHLYNSDNKYYSTYLYGRNSYLRENRSESLGEALTLLWDIAPADIQQTISKNMPFTPFGAPIFYPYIEEMPAYHNNAVWPFVSSYVGMAYAKTLNTEGVLYSLATIYRAATLFCTNKENFEATTGDYRLTQVNSSNMLWSLSGNIGMTHKVLFGIKFTKEGLRFSPVIPKEMQGHRELNGFKYRDATLNIEVDGYGSSVVSFMIDGEQQTEPLIKTDVKGEHNVKIVLKSTKDEISKINMVDNISTPRLISEISNDNGTISWQAIQPASEYVIYQNGIERGRIDIKRNISTYSLNTDSLFSGELQICAYDKKYGMGFASEPIRLYDKELFYEVEDYSPRSEFAASGYNGNGFVKTDKDTNTKITMKVNIPDAGWYAMDLKYANGNGPVNTDNKCAIRSINLDGKYLGSIVMPHRGTGEWNNWGWTNSIKSYFAAGEHTIEIYYANYNINMNIKTNMALIDCLRLTKSQQ